MDRRDRCSTPRAALIRPALIPPVLAGLILLASAGGARPAAGRAPAGPRGRDAPLVVVLCYHDLAADPASPTYTLAPESLRVHIRRAKADGWTFLPLSAVLERRARPDKLPARVMVVTFDDGYRSFLEQALPILREEKVKATLSVITSFVDRPPADVPPLLTWEEIRRLDRGGQAEIAAHSHDLHRLVPSNPYRDTAPAVTARQYFAAESRYETRDEYELRLAQDLHESRRRLREELGHDVAVLAWPYGEHNAVARRLAAAAGFTVTLGLEGTSVAPESLAAGYLPRVMAYREHAIGASDLSWLYPPRRPMRAARVDLDDVHDPDPATVDARLGRIISRLRDIGATHVFLQGLADPAGDGFLRESYFVNHQVPVRADLWSMAAGRLARAGMQVWLRVPAMNLSWEWARHPEWRVAFHVDPAGRRPAPWYYRLSPEIAGVRAAAVDFHTDLAVYLPIRGVLFDDDAYLRADEVLREGGSRDPAAKRDAIRGLLDEIKAAVRAWRPQCRFGRLVYPAVREREGVHPDYAQDLAECVREDDLVVVSADPGNWAGLAGATPSGQGSGPAESAAGAPVLLMFEACDPVTGRWLAPDALESLVRGAERGGARDLGISRVPPVAGELPAGLLRPADLLGPAAPSEPIPPLGAGSAPR